ncbi:MAG: hypothetical protein ACRD4F_12700 [Candidatus Angelobacter sp.]
MRIGTACICFAVASLVGTAQNVQRASQSPHTPTLLELSSSEHSLPHFGFYDEPQCDPDGRIFFHIDTGKYNDSVVMRLSPSAQESKLFKLPDDYSGTAFSGFTITPLGSLRVLAEDKEGFLIFDFDGDGDLTGHTRLALPEHPAISQFASLDNGLSLLAGFVSRRPLPDSDKSVIAIFDASGRHIKDIAYSRKFNINAEADITIRQGFSVAGRDGNFYLLLKDKILVIMPDGHIQRSVTFHSPDPKSIATRLFVSDGTFGIVQRSINPRDGSVKTFFSLLYAATGEEIGYYVLPDDSTGHVLCYSRNEGLSVFGYENKRFILMNAKLK